MSKQQRFLALFLVSFCLYGLFITGVVRKEEGKIDLYYQQKQKGLRAEYLVALNGFSMLADFIFSQKINTPEVLALMHQAANQPGRRDLARARLLELLTPLYAEITRLHFRQLHFHLPDSSSFLRFHRPRKYGDSLVGVRDTVVAANTTKEKITGFEEGRIFNGFRFVYPLFYQQQHCGSVEISISFAALDQALSRLFMKTYLFVLNRAVVEQKVFAAELGNYKQSPLSPRLLNDREVMDLAAADTADLPAATIELLDRAIADHHQRELERWQPVTFSTEIDGAGYVATMLPINNYTSKPVAYLLSYEEDRVPLNHRRDFIFTLLLLTILFLGTLHFILFTHRARKRFEKLSAIDALTGVWARGKGAELFGLEHERARRYHTPYVLILLDVDHFKSINDTFGHQTGDQVLIRLTGLLRDNLRKSDYLCRWGGEEFIIFLPQTSQPAGLAIAEKLRQLVAECRFKWAGAVTISLGLTSYEGGETSLEEIIRRADQALYEAKKSGRNRTCQLPASGEESG